MNLQKRTPEAIAQDVNLLVRLGWKRDQQPPYETDGIFFQKDGKTARISTSGIYKDYLDSPMLNENMFDSNGHFIEEEAGEIEFLPF